MTDDKTVNSEANGLVKEAEAFFKGRQLDEAGQYYKEAGILYRRMSDHANAAYCFGQSSLCEKLKTGLEPLLEAANLSEMAAREAWLARDFAQARWQFREAGLLYEREGDFFRYSHCFIESQHAFVSYLFFVFMTGYKQERNMPHPLKASVFERMTAFFRCIMGLLSRFIWCYGESPFRTVFAASVMILCSAIVYSFSGLLAFQGQVGAVSFWDALYFSGVTFTTLGYGDYTPVGWIRLMALLECLSGFIMVPLFMIALTRRYLRVYR